jgi:hypothetical protein
VEDLAGCATDDLTGWTERKDGEASASRVFSTASISRDEAEAMIMQARVKAGWMTRRRWRRITATRSALETAIRDKAIVRAFRGKATVPADLPDLVERLLEKSALEALSLANKAGKIVTGATRVEAALRQEAVALVVHASDAAADGIRKLDAAARAAEADGWPLPVQMRAFRGEQLDLALGRPNVVHAALLAHPASAGFLLRCLSA